MRINRILGIRLTENTLFEPCFCVFLRRIQYSKDHSLLEYCSLSPVSKKNNSLYGSTGYTLYNCCFIAKIWVFPI